MPFTFYKSFTMRDQISEDRIKLLHPSIRTEVTELIDKIEAAMPVSMKIRVVQGLRTIEEQNNLYAQGRTIPGPVVTKARGGKSYHNYGLAIDFCIMYDKDNNGSFESLSWDIFYDHDKNGKRDWLQVVDVFKQMGYKYGGDWISIKDYPHLEKSFGYTVSQLFEKYRKKDFIPGTNYLRL
jgi:peptidoglycan L-alanyl-D-glutamate endopeptidase CwlK